MVNSYRYTYTYDNNGNLFTALEENWSNNSWVNYRRYSATYDNNGNPFTVLEENWSNNTWVNSYIYTYTYDNNGHLLTRLYEQWSNNSWVNSSIYTYTYDNNGNELTRLYEQWTNNAWVNSWRYTYTYDNNGNELTDLYEKWTNNAFKSNKRSYTYDNNGNAIHGVSYVWKNVWTIANGNLSLSYNSRKGWLYFYGDSVNVQYTSPVVTGVKEPSINTNTFVISQNYPNPFNPSTTISYTLPERSGVVISVYDPLGNKVAELLNGSQSAGSHSVNWNAANMVSGVYFYEIKTDKFRAVKKLLLMK